MKVKLPRLKEEPKPDAEASGEFRDGAQLAETEMGSERRSIYQAQVESFLEDGSRSKSTRFPCLPTKHDGKVLDISLRIDISTRKKKHLGGAVLSYKSISNIFINIFNPQ